MNTDKYYYYDNPDLNIWNISLVFYSENYGILLGMNKENKIEIPEELIKEDDKSLIDVIVRCFMKKMICYDNMLIQELLMTNFREYYVEIYRVEPNEYNYNEWYTENIEKSNKRMYELKFDDIIKNIFESWIDENRIMVYDVPFIKNKEHIKNRLYMINIDDMNVIDNNLLYSYPIYYNYHVQMKKKEYYNQMLWGKLMYFKEEDCSTNLQNVFDYIYMGVYI
jgi:hypothetical protein